MPNIVSAKPARPAVSRTATQQLRSLLVLLAGFGATGSLSGCLMVGGSSRGGFFIFPGGLGLLVIIVVVALLLRRR